jgi:hypothetical protein
MIYGCLFVIFSSINFVSDYYQFCHNFFWIWICTYFDFFSFYVMLKIDDRFRYLGYELDSRSINCFDVTLCFQFLFVCCVGIFFGSSMVKLIANPIENRATLMYVLNINNITKDVGCMFWVELIQILWCGR